MALAFLQFKGISNGHYTFLADIGTARCFRYVLAENRNKLKIGKNEFIEVLTEDKKVSKLFQINESIHKINKGSFPLKIPESEINENSRYVQLYSFPNQVTNVPTISNIVRLYPKIGRANEVSDKAYSSSLRIYNKNKIIMQKALVKNKEFEYQEPQLSKVMFWNAIINALPTIVQHGAPLLGGLLNSSNTNNSSSNQNTSTENDKTTQVVNKVIEVLAAISNNSNAEPITQGENQLSGSPQSNTSSPPRSNRPDEATAQSYYNHAMAVRLSSAYNLEPETIIGLKPILEKILTPEAILAIGDEPKKLFLAIKDAVQKTEIADNQSASETAKNNQSDISEKYSQAKIAPALLAALPALMPVIEKALDPKLIEAIGNQPIKLFQAIGDSVLKMNEQEMKHLEAINPGVDSADDIAKLLQGMSISSSNHQQDIIKFKMIKNLNLDFVNTKTVQFKNKYRVLLSKNQRISIPFKIVTDNKTTLTKTLNKSIIQILIKDAESMDLVFRKNINLLNVNISVDINEAFLTPEEISGIPCNKELKLELSCIWKSSKSENIGVFKSHYIHFVDRYIFDRIGDRIGEPVLFNDINLHRNYWHKIWEGGFSQSSRWQVEFDLKYYYLLNLNEKDISRLETKNNIVDDNVEFGKEHPNRRKVYAKLKSGTEFGPNALNNILTLLNQQVLDESILQVLSKSSMEKSFHEASRIRLEMKGREGDTSTLWSYPEISLFKLHLSQIGNVDSLGQVISLSPVEKIIPKPEFIHFIGTTSER